MALMAPATTAAAHAGDVWSTQPATAHGDASSRYVDMPGVLGGGGCDTDQGEGGMESHVQGVCLRDRLRNHTEIMQFALLGFARAGVWP
jgi:hypothetical protein